MTEMQPIDRYSRTINPQGWEVKKPKTRQEIFEEAIRMSYLNYSNDLQRWELIGPGTNKLLACIKLHEEATIFDLVDELLSGEMIGKHEDQLNTWINRVNPHSDRFYDYEKRLEMFSHLRQSLRSSEGVSITISPLERKKDYTLRILGY